MNYCAKLAKIDQLEPVEALKVEMFVETAKEVFDKMRLSSYPALQERKKTTKDFLNFGKFSVLCQFFDFGQFLNLVKFWPSKIYFGILGEFGKFYDFDLVNFQFGQFFDSGQVWSIFDKLPFWEIF